VRIFNAFVQHFNSNPQKLAPNRDSTMIFQPLITRSRAPLLEIDYNMHKSNATYYSDLDVSRTHLLLALFQQGLASIRAADDGPHAGRLAIVLGAVHCSFRREIKPYQPYEMWSRVLCWDRKWLYIVTHFVKQGAIEPSGYTLQPSRHTITSWLLPRAKNSKNDGGGVKDSGEHDALPVADIAHSSVHPAVFATAISKYVLKKGRLTISPERLITGSGLLPSRAECDESLSAEANLQTGAAMTVAPDCDAEWASVEEERRRGLRFAQHFAELDSLHEEFGAQSRPALGAYVDFLP
jgi:hypothetical protein